MTNKCGGNCTRFEETLKLKLGNFGKTHQMHWRAPPQSCSVWETGWRILSHE